jgi:UTP--glucose-1-phosphate uridylyltransferase
MDGTVPATKQLTEIYEATGKGAIHVEEVPREKVHMYGIIDAKPAQEGKWKERLLKISDLVEKPSADKAPSNWGVSGRYVLPPEIFDHLAKTKPGAGGEIQLTDGLRALAAGPSLWAYIYEGKTLDAGDKLGYLEATVELALKNPKFGNDFRNYLKDLKV